MELHQFVVVTKESPLNHTQVNGEVTDDTKVVCHLQQRPTYDEEGNETSQGKTHTVFLEDLPADIQTKAMELFALVVPYSANL